jgi:hypothetical protein
MKNESERSVVPISPNTFQKFYFIDIAIKIVYFIFSKNIAFFILLVLHIIIIIVFMPFLSTCKHNHTFWSITYLSIALTHRYLKYLSSLCLTLTNANVVFLLVGFSMGFGFQFFEQNINFY